MSSKLFSYTMKSHFALKSIPYQYTINHIRFVSIRWGARKSTSRIDYRWHIQLIPTSTLVSFERRAQFKQKLYFKKMHIISCFKLHNCAEQFAPIVLTTMHGGYVVLPPHAWWRMQEALNTGCPAMHHPPVRRFTQALLSLLRGVGSNGVTACIAPLAPCFKNAHWFSLCYIALWMNYTPKPGEKPTKTAVHPGTQEGLLTQRPRCSVMYFKDAPSLLLLHI